MSHGSLAMTVKEIASRLGYEHRTHLAQQFHKHTGLWPQEFRKGQKA